MDGFISEISVSIPWASLLSESSVVQINGLHLVIQPKERSIKEQYFTMLKSLPISPNFPMLYASLTEDTDVELIKSSNDSNTNLTHQFKHPMLYLNNK